MKYKRYFSGGGSDILQYLPQALQMLQGTKGGGNSKNGNLTQGLAGIGTSIISNINQDKTDLVNQTKNPNVTAATNYGIQMASQANPLIGLGITASQKISDKLTDVQGIDTNNDGTPDEYYNTTSGVKGFAASMFDPSSIISKPLTTLSTTGKVISGDMSRKEAAQTLFATFTGQMTPEQKRRRDEALAVKTQDARNKSFQGNQLALNEQVNRLAYLQNKQGFSSSPMYAKKGGNTKGWIGKAVEKMKEKDTVGTFTEYCKGKVTQDCIERGKNSPNKTIQKRAIFAENIKKK